MWKIPAVQIMEEIYYPLISRGLFLEEQKRYRKGVRGTGELLHIDQHIFKDSKMRCNNVAITWIDNKKTYDMVLQS